MKAIRLLVIYQHRITDEGQKLTNQKRYYCRRKVSHRHRRSKLLREIHMEFTLLD